MMHIAKRKALGLFQGLSQDQKSNLRGVARRSKTLYEFSMSAWGLPSDKEIEDAAKEKGIRNVWTEDNESFVETFRDLYLSQLWALGRSMTVSDRDGLMHIMCKKRAEDIMNRDVALMWDIFRFGVSGYEELSDEELIERAEFLGVLEEAVEEGYAK